MFAFMLVNLCITNTPRHWIRSIVQWIFHTTALYCSKRRVVRMNMKSFDLKKLVHDTLSACVRRIIYFLTEKLANKSKEITRLSHFPRSFTEKNNFTSDRASSAKVQAVSLKALSPWQFTKVNLRKSYEILNQRIFHKIKFWLKLSRTQFEFSLMNKLLIKFHWVLNLLRKQKTLIGNFYRNAKLDFQRRVLCLNLEFPDERWVPIKFMSRNPRALNIEPS